METRSTPTVTPVLIVPMILVASILSAAIGHSADWPRWRGPDGNGITTEDNWSTSAITGEPEIAWQAQVGEGHSCPIIVGDHLFTVGNVDQNDIVYCLNAKTGKGIWRFAFASDPGGYDGPRSTPTYSEGRLYFLSRWGDVLCLDAQKGSTVWKTRLQDLEIDLPKWGLAGSPVIHDGLVILNVGKHGIALDAKTGAIRWNSGQGVPGYATPVLFKRGDSTIAAIFSSTELVLVDAATGKRITSHPWQTKYDINAADPIVIGDRVFISSGYGKGCALLDISGAKPAVVWQNENMRNQFSSSLLIDGYLYGVDGNTGGGSLSCLRLSDGAEMWSEGGGFEAISAAGKRLLTIDKKGVLKVVEANPNEFRLLAQAQVFTARGAKNWTMPVLANSTIYCRNSVGELVAIPVGE